MGKKQFVKRFVLANEFCNENTRVSIETKKQGA
jgi:hypothetical protein